MLEASVFVKALKVLEKAGKAKVFTNQSGEIGVKFS